MAAESNAVKLEILRKKKDPFNGFKIFLDAFQFPSPINRNVAVKIDINNNSSWAKRFMVNSYGGHCCKGAFAVKVVRDILLLNNPKRSSFSPPQNGKIWKLRSLKSIYFC